MQKYILRPELFVYLAIPVFAGAFFLLSLLNADSADKGLFEYYAKFASDKAIWVAVVFALVLLGRFMFFVVKASIQALNPLAIFSFEHLSRTFLKGIRQFFKNFLQIGIPFILAFSIFSKVIGQVNNFNTSRLIDELVFQWDVFLTGTFPALTWTVLQYPEWFVDIVDVSFMQLATVFLFFAVYLFQASPKLFREATGTFFLSAIIMLVGWLLFPVLSPHDRFIDNAYNLPISSEVQEYVDDYQPQEEIAAFLEEMRSGKESLSVLPTTTLPSAHIAWAVLLAYYAWRLWRWLGIIFLPFAILSSLGTVLFAQHYFVDVPAGIVVAIFSIWLVKHFSRNG